MVAWSEKLKIPVRLPHLLFGNVRVRIVRNPLRASWRPIFREGTRLNIDARSHIQPVGK